MSLVSRCLSYCESSSSLYSPVSPVILNLLKSCKALKTLQQIHSQIIRQGFEQDHFIITQFISLCNSLSSNFTYISSVFDRVNTPNIYLWNTLIKVKSQHSSIEECLLLFRRMKRCADVCGDKYTFPSLLKVCARELAVRDGWVVHGVIVRCGVEGDVFVGSSLVDFYGKCREIECARKVFDEMSVRNEVSYTAMIVGYANVGDFEMAVSLFEEMPCRNVASWNAVINVFVRVGDLGGARKLFDLMPEKNVVSFTTMIDAYAKSGDMASARFLFEQSTSKDVVLWSALISGYTQNGQANEAVKLFTDLRAQNVRPDEYIIVSLMSACSQIGNLELAKWVDSYISQSSLDLRRPHVVAALVDMHAKCGNMEKATMLFKKMPKRDLISYCSMIQGLSIHGCGPQAVALFYSMLSEGIIPDDVAFTVILSACSHAGLVEEGCQFFDVMVNKYSIVPSPDHYACIIDLLGRAGKLKAAYDVLKSMPIERYAGAWGALLGACNYVLLSNIYAEEDRWLDVSLVRNKMLERGLRKVPGCTRIQSNSEKN
ncbi:putative pentatricopeptide repeat-containing protein At5g37570 isoform X2 [Daucus carota subsp. sativus]|uniref:putative pentatricopeptide repeat-containing protein At5g37570 isoform X2 n=1 Tax=Daucus carota subsp. sativus TaxID=79200 RepID=UPI0007EFEB29|nr:PREDICTED: putative pentatricopeptide repeat-containing protein At5g37570 isoform X2 [Daucus carota subsp. sativus]